MNIEKIRALAEHATFFEDNGYENPLRINHTGEPDCFIGIDEETGSVYTVLYEQITEDAIFHVTPPHAVKDIETILQNCEGTDELLSIALAVSKYILAAHNIMSVEQFDNKDFKDYEHPKCTEYVFGALLDLNNAIERNEKDVVPRTPRGWDIV